jgi:hypothetical protein
VDSLSSVDRELFRIQDFIIEYEMNGLSGYFYNRLPDVANILAAVAAMRKHGLPEMASFLGEAAQLFVGYVDPDPPTTWEVVLRQYDPANQLAELELRIRKIRGYGITEMLIAEK